MLVVAGTLVYAALQNDVFSELIPPMDDLGFTHDNVLAVGVPRDHYVLGGMIFDRWITSRVDRRRWDQLDLFATMSRNDAWPSSATPSRWLVTTGARLGPTLGGDFGGQYVQNGWHSISGTGPTVEEGLANDYPDDDRVGVLAGARVHAVLALAGNADEVLDARAMATRPSSPSERWRDVQVALYANADAQLARAAGVSSVEGSAGARLGAYHLGAHVEAAVTRYHVADPNLALPGGYGVGWQFEWRAGIDVTWSRYRLAYEYRANEGGSGEPIGVVAFSLH